MGGGATFTPISATGGTITEAGGLSSIICYTTLPGAYPPFHALHPASGCVSGDSNGYASISGVYCLLDLDLLLLRKTLNKAAHMASRLLAVTIGSLDKIARKL